MNSSFPMPTTHTIRVEFFDVIGSEAAARVACEGVSESSRVDRTATIGGTITAWVVLPYGERAAAEAALHEDDRIASYSV